ncbi:SRPBCC family protein [Streptomyces sp. AN091965]|uniref:SRPBCC family protein n=1 Tax=Streptomyces sp. AN091965 TaxID=2927803 RepID=UPI001F60CB6C|nr:SRPBCC family protein [Streptomyces sp. AN091965]MCI3934908.1 SRPBCC family protein [Streptomyces sp. AN091965]
MPRRLRPVGLDFLVTAPVRHVFTGEVSAPPETVFQALAVDVAQWPAWFTSVTRARPTRDGAGRAVHLQGGFRLLETILAADAPTRYVYRVDVSNAPGVRALVEEWHLTPTATGTRVRWTFAVEPRGLMRFLFRHGRRGLGKTFDASVRNLDRRLSGTKA